jgi:two-component system, cell cycle response regulator
VEPRKKLPINLLYVEDELAIREQFERLLKRVVKDVKSASNGEEGLELFRTYKPDVVMTDIKMPKMNGLEMSRAIREISKSVPIIITTAHSEFEFLVEAIGIGVSDFLPKPVDTEHLIETLQKKSHDIYLEKELEKERKRFETILNFQENMIILTDGIKIVEANKSFFDFFKVSSTEEFARMYGCIDSQFILDGRMIHKIDGESWIHNLIQNKFERNVVKIIDMKSAEERTFIVRASKFPDDDEDLYIVSMSDITEMEKEAKTLELLATTDPLTKIYNRLKLNEILMLEIKKSDRYGIPLSIIMLDIDHFKEVNDTYGHDVGDEVLIRLTKSVSANIREVDMFARWGGEEFVIMLPNTDEKGAAITAENLRFVIENTDFGKAGKISASFGVAEYQPNLGFRELLKRVDDALYEAKRGGRNMVCIL